MHIRIVYYNGEYDYVTAPNLGRLLRSGRVKAFFRPLVRRWVYIGYDSVRGVGGAYAGPERRRDGALLGEA
jgi:hypothetical protein